MHTFDVSNQISNNFKKIVHLHGNPFLNNYCARLVYATLRLVHHDF